MLAAAMKLGEQELARRAELALRVSDLCRELSSVAPLALWTADTVASMPANYQYDAEGRDLLIPSPAAAALARLRRLVGC